MLRTFDNKIAFDIDQVLTIHFYRSDYWETQRYTIVFRDGKKSFIQNVPYYIPFEDVYPEFVAWFRSLGKDDKCDTN